MPLRKSRRPDPSAHGALPDASGVVASSPPRPPAKRRAPWREKNFLTEVLLPSLRATKEGTRTEHAPTFPSLGPDDLCLTWIGHASFLVQTERHNILIDPNWANWLMIIRRLRHAGLEIEHLPEIDVVLVTHAHFDHLNRRSLRRVAAQQPILVPTGVRRLVSGLGFNCCHEMAWWDEWEHDGLKVTFTPANHWGARRLIDRGRGYGGYVIEYRGRSLYACGDSAWFDGFKEIGQRHHPEIALLPIGAYENPSGRDHHISPEEAVRAFIDLKAHTLVPMHFGTYRISYEPLDEPPQRLMRAAAAAGCISHLCFMNEGEPVRFPPVT